jgi:hypothetical protein
MPNREENDSSTTGPNATSASAPQGEPVPEEEMAVEDRLFGNLLKLRGLPCVLEPEYRDEPREPVNKKGGA